MNRELKFRLYDSDDKKMYYDVGIEPLCFTLFEYMGNKLLPPKQVGYIGKDCDNAHIMQYINSKDRNGIEVYDGDILKAPSGDFFVVKWYEDEMRWAMLSKDTWYNMNMGLLTVLGNIYENLEIVNQ